MPKKKVSLDVTKAEKFLGERLPNVKEGIEEFKRLRDEGYLEELKYDSTKNNCCDSRFK